MNFQNDSHFLLVISFFLVSETLSHGQTMTGCYCESAAMLPGIQNIVCTAKCCEEKISKLKDYALPKLIKQFLQLSEL